MNHISAQVQIARNRGLSIKKRDLAFGEIVSLFRDMALSLAWGLLRDEHLAQDAVQESFLAAYENLDKLKTAEAFPGWFRQIVLSCAGRIVRKKKIPTEPLESTGEHASPEPGPDELAEKNEARKAVVAAIALLPDHESSVVRQFYFDGSSQDAIAKDLGLEVSTVKSRLHSSRRRIRRSIEGGATSCIASTVLCNTKFELYPAAPAAL